MLTATNIKIVPCKLLINGEWTNSTHQRTFNTVKPASGDVITQVAEATREDVDRAVKAARSAFDDVNGKWRRLSASERGRILWRIADLIESHIEEFAELETIDNGK